VNWSALESLVAAPPPSNRVVGSIFPYHRLAFGVAGGFWFRARHSRNHWPRSSGAFRLGIRRRNVRRSRGLSARQATGREAADWPLTATGLGLLKGDSDRARMTQIEPETTKPKAFRSVGSHKVSYAKFLGLRESSAVLLPTRRTRELFKPSHRSLRYGDVRRLGAVAPSRGPTLPRLGDVLVGDVLCPVLQSASVVPGIMCPRPV
jgi:hypothetical protein